MIPEDLFFIRDLKVKNGKSLFYEIFDLLAYSFKELGFVDLCINIGKKFVVMRIRDELQKVQSLFSLEFLNNNEVVENFLAGFALVDEPVHNVKKHHESAHLYFSFYTVEFKKNCSKNRECENRNQNKEHTPSKSRAIDVDQSGEK